MAKYRKVSRSHASRWDSLRFMEPDLNAKSGTRRALSSVVFVAIPPGF
jgi:hypothetical protein